MKKTVMCVLLAGLLLAGTASSVSAAPAIETIPDGTEFGAPAYAGNPETSAREVAELIDRAWEYYTDNFFVDGYDWVDATFHIGALAAYRATGEQKYYDDTYAYAEGHAWQANEGVLTDYPDDIAAMQVYCILHSLAPADYKLEGVKAQLDYNYRFNTLCYLWVDEIYMIGLAQSYYSKVTGNRKYSEIDLNTYLHFRNFFFDAEDMLWYRDFKYIYGGGNSLSESPNGKKVFWGRGNAWVYVSLAQRLEYMDPSDPAYAVYLNDFLMMSEGLRRVQRDDGVWNANLGDPDDHSGKEMTGTGGFVYGMALGVRLGLLDPRTYIPVLQRAYETISERCIDSDGRVLYCQPVGERPSTYTGEAAMRGSTNSFGVGLNLMGLAEFMRLCSDYEEPELHPEVRDFDPSKAVYAADEGWYKGTMSVTVSGQTSIQEGNGPENLVNGVWAREDVGSRMSVMGLLSRSITVTVDLHREVTLEKLALNVYQNRAYKYTVELYSGGSWVKVVDTTQTPMEKATYFKHSFAPTAATQVRLIVSGCWTENTDAVSIRELFLYESR